MRWKQYACPRILEESRGRQGNCSSSSMAKRLCFLIAVLWTLAVPPPAAAQCRTEIIVYLDISGSTNPTGRDPATSPFAATVEALDALLAARDMVGEQDVVNVRLFGESVRGGGRFRAEGPRALQRLVADLRENTANDSLTDLVAVLQDLDSELDDDSTFARRLVIFASDYVHETDSSVNQERFLDDWRQRVADLDGAILERLAARETTTVFRFFVLPPWQPRNRPAGYFRPLQNAVLDTVDPERRRRIPLDSLSPDDLAREIRAALLYPPSIEGTVISEGGRPRLRVQVANINCQPVRLDTLMAYCPETGGDPVPMALDGGAVALPARGANATHKAKVDLDDLGCAIGDRVEIIAKFEGGRPSKPFALGAENEIYARPTQSVFESSVLEEKLYLYLDLRGQKLTDEAKELQLSRDSAEIFRGRFELPDSLREEFQTYLFEIDLDGGAINHQRSLLEVSVIGATMESTEIEILRKRFESYVNHAFGLCSLLMFGASLWGMFTPKQRTFFSNRADRAISWGASAFSTLAVLAIDHFRASPISLFWDQWLRWILLSAIFGWIVFLVLRQRHLMALDKRIELLYRIQLQQEDEHDKDQGDMAAVAAAVARVEAIVEMAGQKLRVVGVSVLAAFLFAAAVWGVLNVLRPAASSDLPTVRETIQITQN